MAGHRHRWLISSWLLLAAIASYQALQISDGKSLYVARTTSTATSQLSAPSHAFPRRSFVDHLCQPTTAGCRLQSPYAALALGWPLPSPASTFFGLGAFATAAVCILGAWSRPKPSVSKAAPDHAMALTYTHLADRLLARLATLPEGQWWVAIAGPPGAGKSTLAAAVARAVNERAGADLAVVVPMDGFHYSRKQLKAIAQANGDKGPTFEELLARRGAPWTFGAPALCVALADARQLGTASLPAYSRQLSDPVPDGVRLERHHRIVLVEGNYLLLQDDPLWAPLASIFDERWFLRAPMDVVRDRLVQRALETWTPEKDRLWGPGAVGAAAKVDNSDLSNAELVNGTAKYADLIVDSIQ